MDGLFTYTGTVYGMAALWALPAAMLTLQPAVLTLKTVSAVVAAGLIPLGIGHTLYNAALRRTNATIVNLDRYTKRVTGGIVLGAIFLGQVPQTNEIVGAVVALIGIAVVLI